MLKETILNILKTVESLSQENLNHIESVINASNESNMIYNLMQANLLSHDCLSLLQSAINSDDPAEKTDRLNATTIDQNIWFLPSDKKKDILLAHQAILENVCSLYDINQCFQEQATTNKRSLLLGQIMLKNHYITIDVFSRLHKIVEKEYNENEWESLYNFSKQWKVTYNDNQIHIEENSIPKKLGSYKILEELGHGAMGVVYKAWDENLERIVALKVLKVRENSTPEELKRFQREEQLAANLNHPNIVNIYNAGVVDNFHYFSMEYIEGKTLEDYMASGEHSIREKLHIIYTIALALDYAHTKNIIHRDVKPENILVDKTNRPLLSDFGLAKGINSFESQPLTQTGETIGTACYMSPEQAKGEHIDARSDIYSLGAVLYQLLAGRPPFTGSLGNVLECVLHKLPTPLSNVNSNIDRALSIICAKAMAKNMNDRYQTAKAMAEDIKHYLYGEKILAKPIARYKTFFRNKKIYFFISFVSIIFIFIVIFIVVSAKYYYAIQERKQQKILKFKKFQENLTSKNFTTAFKHLASLRNNSAESNKINEQLQQLSQQYSSQGLANLDKYKNTLDQLQLQYDTKYQNLMNVSPEEQEKKLCELQKIITQQMAIKIDLGNAFANFWCSILCDPTNFFAYDNFKKIYLQKIQELDSQYNFHWDTIVLDILHNASNFNNIPSIMKKVSIKSVPENVQVDIFRLEELFFRTIPIQWRLTKNPSAYFSNDFSSWIHRIQPIIDSNSTVSTCTPKIWMTKLFGNYLVVLSSPGYKQERHLVKLWHPINYELNVSLTHECDELKDYCYIDFPEHKGRIKYFVAEKEVTEHEYKQYKKETPDTEKPVTNITYQEALDYCKYMTEKSQHRYLYRLPTVKEWQYIAGDYDNRTYPWGRKYFSYLIKSTKEKKICYDETIAGVKYMASNVSEWCSSEQKNTEYVIACGGNDLSINENAYQVHHIQQYPNTFKAPYIGFRILVCVPQN